MTERLAKVLLCTTLAALALTSTVSARPPGGAAGQHCVAKLEQVTPGVPKSRVTKLDCYPSFSEAIYAATEGKVWLPANEGREAQLQVLDRELKSLKATTPTGGPVIIAIDYWDSIWRGASLTYQTNAPCSSTVAYQLAAIPDPWNDQLSSSRGFSDCNSNIHFEHANFGGAILTCTPTCLDFGALNDKTSSRLWVN